MRPQAKTKTDTKQLMIVSAAIIGFILICVTFGWVWGIVVFAALTKGMR